MNTAQFNLLKAGIECYTGKEVTNLLTHPDPKVQGSYALRAQMDNGETIDFVLSASLREPKTLEDVVDFLEEGTFKTWPPKSGQLRFFI